MSAPAPRQPLAPELAARLAEFARACKAAVRAVSLYPAGHPGTRSSLSRLAEVASRATAGGGLELEVQPQELLVEGRTAARPDPAIAELAALLHRHLIGRLVVRRGTDTDSWRSLLVFLARAPEDVRASGGIAELWAKAGGPSIEIHEIDYAELLREQAAEAATVDAIIAYCLKDSRIAADDSLMEALLGFVGDPAKLELLVEELQARATTGGVGGQTAAVLRLMRSLADFLARTRPEGLEEGFRLMSGIVAQLSPDVVTTLLRQRATPEAMAGSINVVGSLVEQIQDTDVAHFVARAVMTERGPTERLAEAFQALVPGPDQQRQLLAMAEEEVAGSPLGQDESFPEMWGRVEKMLLSYSDEQYVSEAYGRELSSARARAVEVEQTSDDSPERIASWLETISDPALRGLDRQLLLDLMAIETDPARWREVVETVVAQVDDLTRAGHFEAALTLVQAVAGEAGAEAPSDRRGPASSALQRLARGPLMAHAVSHLRTGDDQSYGLVSQLCYTLGPNVISPLAEILSTEQDARARRRLRDILIGFGARGRESVQQLMSAANWEVRRTAAYLLREFGGTDTLAELEPLLNDSEPLVQREAIRALLLIGDDRAYELLARAAKGGKHSLRETLLQELVSLRDERATPFCCYLIQHLDHRSLPDLFISAINALAGTSGPQAAGALRVALYRGEWWAPRRTHAIRSAAAAALRKTGSAEALQILRDASAHGPRAVRAIARAQLAQLVEQR